MFVFKQRRGGIFILKSQHRRITNLHQYYETKTTQIRTLTLKICIIFLLIYTVKTYVRFNENFS